MWSNCGQSVPHLKTKKFRKTLKALKTQGFQGFSLVEISGIEPLTS